MIEKINNTTLATAIFTAITAAGITYSAVNTLHQREAAHRITAETLIEISNDDRITAARALRASLFNALQTSRQVVLELENNPNRAPHLTLSLSVKEEIERVKTAEDELYKTLNTEAALNAKQPVPTPVPTPPPKLLYDLDIEVVPKKEATK